MATACRDRQVLRIDYRKHDGTDSTRAIEPHRLVHRARRWYLVARDRGRSGWRTFRVDRLRVGAATGQRYVPRELPDADLAAYVRRGIRSALRRCEARVTVLAPAAAVVGRVPPDVLIEPIDENICVVHAYGSTPEVLALHLGWLDADFFVAEPPSWSPVLCASPPASERRLGPRDGRLARATIQVPPSRDRYLRHEHLRPSAGRAASGTLVAAVPPLLERESQLSQLTAAMAAAEAGDGRMVLIGGEAGIGKSSLVERFARTQTPRRALIGICDPVGTPPALAPLLELAGGLEPSLPAELSSSAAPGPRLFEALAAEPRLLIVEDVHWADQATLDVLRYLGRRVTRLPVLIVATFRSEDAGAGSPLSMLLGDLATAAGVARMELPPLSLAATRVLAGGDVELLHRRTGGNPFFIREVMAGGGMNVPATVRDAVMARAFRLSAAGRAALEAAAVAGTRTPAARLAALLDRDDTPRWGMEEAMWSGFLVRDAVRDHPEVDAVSPVAPALVELAVLRGETGRARDIAGAGLDRAGGAWEEGELWFWVSQAGLATPTALPEPYALLERGEWRASAAWWQARGCRYEHALTLSLSGDGDALRESVRLLDGLDARPAAGLVRRRLRALGIGPIPRGPHGFTRSNVAGLTEREHEVLSLIAEGLGNPAIARRLFLSPKTVERHVSAVLRKLDVEDRTAAVAAARRMGALEDAGAGPVI